MFVLLKCLGFLKCSQKKNESNRGLEFCPPAFIFYSLSVTNESKEIILAVVKCINIDLHTIHSDTNMFECEKDESSIGLRIIL